MLWSPPPAPAFSTFRSADLDDAREMFGSSFFASSLDMARPRARYEFRADVASLGELTVGQTWQKAGLVIVTPELATDYYVMFTAGGHIHSEHRGVEVLAGPERAAVYQPFGDS